MSEYSNCYYGQVINMWSDSIILTHDNPRRDLASELKIFIVNDLTNIGINILDVYFYVELTGINNKKVRIIFKNSYTRSIFMNYTREQIIRKIKLSQIV